MFDTEMVDFYKSTQCDKFILFKHYSLEEDFFFKVLKEYNSRFTTYI